MHVKKRPTKTLREIERLLAQAVRKTPGCEDFVSLVVHVVEAGPDGFNWSAGFANYGRANHMVCNEALARAVQELGLQFDAVG